MSVFSFFGGQEGDRARWTAVFDLPPGPLSINGEGGATHSSDEQKRCFGTLRTPCSVATSSAEGGIHQTRIAKKYCRSVTTSGNCSAPSNVSTPANCIFLKKICHKFRPRRHNIYEGIIPPLAQSGGRYVQRFHIARQIAGHSMRVLRASKHHNPLWTQFGLW